jgi:hypothetical protein
MKSTRKITKLQLEDNLTEDFVLLGLVSSDPDYRLSLSLNKKFRISLKNIPPISITDETGKEMLFSRFSSAGKSSSVIYNLIANRSGKSFFLKKLKNIDYILQIIDPEEETDIEKLSSMLRETESVTAIFRVDQGAIKDKNLNYLIQ